MKIKTISKMENKKIIVCRKCGKELNNGFYNTPKGIYCPKCWEEKTEEETEQLYKEAIKNLAELVRPKRENDKDIGSVFCL